MSALPSMGEVEFWKSPFDSGPEPKPESKFDVIIVGGGPAGSAAASYLAMENKKVLLLEKGCWPRDKVCGDAVGGKSLAHVAALGVKPRLENNPHFKVTSIIFGAPNGIPVNIPLPKEEMKEQASGYSLPRIIFDRMLFERAAELISQAGGFIAQSCNVKKIIHNNEEGDKRIFSGVSTNLGDFFAPMIIGAAGYTCPVARVVVKETYSEELVNREHYCGGWREYWTDVEGCNVKEGAIEIHFLKGSSGCLWLFPVGNGVVNVGIGMVLSELDKQQQKLRDMQADLINNHPIFKKRFSAAIMQEGSGKGWQLPFGSPRENTVLQPRRAFANGVLLIGDSASLVDPFSGEGIGNALYSAKVAVDSILKYGEITIKSGREYQDAIWEELGDELTNSLKLQKLSRKTFLINWALKKAAKKPKIQKLFTDMIASKEAQGNLHSKWYLLRTFLF